MQTYTLAEVTSLLGLPRPVITGLVAAGFVTPERGARREYRFHFQDLVLLRAAQGLKEAQLPPRRIQRALKALRARLPAEMPVAGLKLTTVGNDVVVRERGSAAWQNAAGQWLLDFEDSAAAAKTENRAADPTQGASVRRLRGAGAAHGAPSPATDAFGAATAEAATMEATTGEARTLGAGAVAAGAPAVATKPPPASRPSPRAKARATSQQWFERAVELEGTDPARAEAAYRHAIAADPKRADAYLNLGALLGEAGRHAEAAAVARLGIERCAREPLLHFNLGVALEDARQPAAAIDAYEHSLALDARLADAHFNLARLHDRLGDKRRAIRHYSAYRRLRPAGS